MQLKFNQSVKMFNYDPLKSEQPAMVMRRSAVRLSAIKNNGNIPQHIRFKISCIPDHCVTLGILHNSAQWQYTIVTAAYLQDFVCTYRMARIFGGNFTLADWRF